MKKTSHEDFYKEFPDAATTCDAIKHVEKKLRHARGHYKDGDEKEFIAHLQEAHSMLENILKSILKEHKGSY